MEEIFLPKFNVEARWKYDLHTNNERNSLNQIFSEHKERKIANDYTIKFENKYYQLYKSDKLRPGKKVCVKNNLKDLKIKIIYD